MYRGWSGTKLHLALIAMGLVSAGFAATGFAKDLYGSFCMAVIAAAGIYSGAAVTAEKLSGKPGAPPPVP